MQSTARFISLAALLALVSSCKPRNPDASGLMSEPSADMGLRIAAGGDWTATCLGVEGDKALYDLKIRGALLPRDEGQDLLVATTKVVDGVAEVLAEREPGHGAIDPAGQVFIGFSSGVLTAGPAATKDDYTHMGVLTLSSDPNVEGLKVACKFLRTSV